MGTIYVDTGGSATNSGSTDQNAANLSGSAATVSGSVVTLDGSPDLSGLVTSGTAQSSIYINDATNSNRKIFWITAFDNTAKTVTVDVAPTGVTSSSWAIGGRVIWTSANIEAALTAGHICQFNNSPASKSGSAFITFRANGDSTSGKITLRGKSGTRPVLTITDTNNVISGNSQNRWLIENLEMVQQGASGHAGTSAAICKFYNVKVSDAGGDGIRANGDDSVVSSSEITGVGLSGVQNNGFKIFVLYNYIHDVAGDGIQLSDVGRTSWVIENIIDTCGGRGINQNGSVTALTPIHVIGNTVYGCGNSGLEVADADCWIENWNNIFSENGNAAGEYNIDYVAGTAERIGNHGYNCFYHSGGGGGANLNSLTTNSTETTSDPLFTNAAGGDFSLSSSSPCKATGYPGAFLGGSTGYKDMGAVQRQEATGGGLLAHPGMRGGFA